MSQRNAAARREGHRQSIEATTIETITASAVQKLFLAAWPRSKQYPNLILCEGVAIRMRIVRDRRKPIWPKPIALKHGKGFLLHAADMCAQLEREASIYSTTAIYPDGEEELIIHDRERYDLYNMAIAALAEAERSVTEALAAWGARRPLYIEDQDPARFVMAAAQEAWERTGCKVPRSVNSDGGLCVFVQGALKRIGRVYTLPAISSVLKGKNRRLSSIPRKYKPRAGRNAPAARGG